MMKITAALAVLLVGCGGSSSTTPAPSNAAAPAPAPAPVNAAPTKVDCDEVCTTYAVCSEEHYGEDFRGGGACVTSCEEMSDADRTAWAKTIEDASAANDCKRLFGDEDRD